MFMNLNPRRQAGVGLIEVLVALLVLSVGLLGMAGLLLKGMRQANEAQLRTQVSVLAYDMLDRIRANRTTAEAGNNYLITLTEDPATPGTDCEAATANCSGSAVAAFDVHRWRQKVALALPAGRGQVQSDGAGASKTFIITLRYNEYDEASDELGSREFTLRSRL